jgi:hypothetical protein
MNGPNGLCISYKPPQKPYPKGIEVVNQFIIGINKNTQFLLSDQETDTYDFVCNSLDLCSICIERVAQTETEESFVRVAAVLPDEGMGSTSSSSDGWVVAKDCGDDRYLNNSGVNLQKWHCVKCPEGGDCEGPITWEKVQAKFGFFPLEDTNIDESKKRYFWPCINEKACFGGKNFVLKGQYFDSTGKDLAVSGGLETCNFDLGFETHCHHYGLNKTAPPRGCRLCRACREGFWPQGVADCTPCPATPGVNIFASMIAAMYVMLLVYSFYRTAKLQYAEDIVHSHHHYAQTLKKIVLNHLQLLGMVASFQLKWPQAVSGYFRLLEIIGTPADVVYNPSCGENPNGNPFLLLEKQSFILFTPLIAVPIIAMSTICGWRIEQSAKEKERKRKQAAQARLAQRGFMLGFEGSERNRVERERKKRQIKLMSEAYGEEKSETSATKVSPAKSNREEKNVHHTKIEKYRLSWKDKFISQLVITVYLLYPSLCKATFSLIACQKVGDNWYLQMNMEMLCGTPEHQAWLSSTFFPALIFYVIGLPLFCFLILWRNRRDLDNPRLKFKYGILYSGYRYQSYYWECIVAVRKAVLFFITIILATVGAEPHALIGILVTLAFTLQHVQKRPYHKVTKARDTLDTAETYALVLVLLTLWCGLFFFQEISQSGYLLYLLSVGALGINVLLLLVFFRWWLIFKLMDLHSRRRHLPVGKQRRGMAGTTMRCIERLVPSWLSQKDSKWQHARSKIKVIARMIIYIKKIRHDQKEKERHQFRKHHIKKRNRKKSDMLPHRSSIDDTAARMDKIKSLKGKLLPVKEKDLGERRQPTRITPLRQLGRRTPTRIFPMGIPSPSLGRRTPVGRRSPVHSVSGSRRSLSPASSHRSRSNSRTRNHPKRQKSPKQWATVMKEKSFKKVSRQKQADLIREIAVKKLKVRQKAMERAEAKRERQKKDPEWQKKQKLLKLKAAMDTQLVAKQGLRGMLDQQSKKLQAEKMKLRGQMEKLMALGKSRKLTKPQVEKLKVTLSALKKKYESLLQTEKALETRRKHL